jgi:hypothetical protein
LALYETRLGPGAGSDGSDLVSSILASDDKTRAGPRVWPFRLRSRRGDRARKVSGRLWTAGCVARQPPIVQLVGKEPGTALEPYASNNTRDSLV